MKPYNPEEQAGTIISAVLYRRLVAGEEAVERIEYLQIDGGAWVIVNDMSMLVVDCTQHVHELKIGDRIHYIGDDRKVMSTGEHPIAKVKDSWGRTVYESPGYREAILWQSK